MKRLLHPSQWNYPTYEAMELLLGIIIWVIALTAVFFYRQEIWDFIKDVWSYDRGYDVCQALGGWEYPC